MKNAEDTTMKAIAVVCCVVLICQWAIAVDPKAGPVGPKTPPAKWGAVVHDAVNDEHVWFGGVGGSSRTGALYTWILKDGSWSRAAPDLPKDPMLQDTARRLYARVANRYYRCETPSEAKVDLAKGYDLVAERVGYLDLAAGAPREAQADAAAKLGSLAGRLKKPPTVKDVADARAAWMAQVKVAWACNPEPPARCKPAMAFDGRTGKIVLFGGEGIHGVTSDTWIYDCKTRRWRNARPKAAPTPRLKAGLIARDGAVYLVGGYAPRGNMSYQTALWQRLPMDVWRYDIAANTWTRLSAGDGKTSAGNWTAPIELSFSGDGKTLRWKCDLLAWGKKKGQVTGEFSLPGKDADTAKAAVGPGTILVRGVGFDPAWYEKAPPVDPEAVAAKLAALPANKWVDMKPPVRPVQRDWGTAVLDARRDQLLQWGGGHCTHCGTDVAHYSIKTNRWHILHTPELPFEYCYGVGFPVPSMTGRPWAEHTYLSYGVDAVTGLMLYTHSFRSYALVNPGGSWVYDPGTYEWTAPQMKIEGGWFHLERHKTCAVATPKGIAVWGCKRTGSGGQSGLWLADVKAKAYRPVAATDANDRTTYPPSVYGDRHGIAYDSKRDRVLMFHFGITGKHKVWATDLKTKKVAVLTPKGSDAFPADASMAREATYIPDADVVIICTRGKPAQHTLIYDCAADAWLKMPGAFTTDKRGRPSPAYGVSSGIEWDAKRKLLWHVNARGHVHAMRFDRASAGMDALRKASRP